MLPVITGEFGVVKDPEIRFTDNGRSWVKVRCSAKDRKRDAQGNWTDADPLFIDIIIGSEAENFVESIRVGDSIIVKGRLKMRQYEVDGGKRTDYQITADEVGVSLRWNTAKTPRALEESGGSVAAVADAFAATEIPF